MSHRNETNFPPTHLADPVPRNDNPIDYQQLTALVRDVDEAIECAAELLQRWERQVPALLDAFPAAYSKQARLRPNSSSG